jgi:hypothetical protein
LLVLTDTYKTTHKFVDSYDEVASSTVYHPERYLELGRAAETKSEYYRGKIFATAGAKLAHTIIVTNLIAELRHQLIAGQKF